MLGVISLGSDKNSEATHVCNGGGSRARARYDFKLGMHCFRISLQFPSAAVYPAVRFARCCVAALVSRLFFFFEVVSSKKNTLLCCNVVVMYGIFIIVCLIFSLESLVIRRLLLKSLL